MSLPVLSLSRTMREKAFSLIELLSVVAIIGVISALAITSFNTIGGSHAITRDGQLVNDQMNLARQIAMTKNRDTELRLITYPGPEAGTTNWAVQIYDTASGEPLHRIARLGDNVVISASSGLSPLLTNLETAQMSFPPLGNGQRDYYRLKFRPNGRVEGNFPPRQDYLTLHLRRENPAEPQNYFSLQIQPLTGRTTIYRP